MENAAHRGLNRMQPAPGYPAKQLTQNTTSKASFWNKETFTAGLQPHFLTPAATFSPYRRTAYE